MGNFSNYWDLTTLFTKIKNKLKSISDKIDDSVSLKTATGNSITLTDAAKANAEELSMTIEPVQSGSGDPSPTNVRPISGLTSGEVTRTGKNVFNLSTYPQTYTIAGVTHTINASEGTISFHRDSASGANHYYSSTESFKLKAGSYILSAVFPTGMPIVRLGINDATVVLTTTGEVAFTLTEDTNISLYLFYSSSLSEDVTISDIMIRSASFTDSTFEPYTANTATITFGQTVYGGSVNFKTGEVTVTHGMVDAGVLTWTYNTTYKYFDCELAPYGYSGKDFGAICSIYANLGPKNPGAMINAENGLYSWGTHINVKDTAYTDAATFKTAMSGVQLCYELATPTTLTLTPAELELLKGNNTITANGAEISLSYYPDNAIGTLAGRVDNKADIPTSTANGGLIPLWNIANGKLNYYSDGAKLFGVTIEDGNPKLRSQSSSSTYANFSANGYEHISGRSLIRVTSPDGIVGSGNGGYNFDLTREKLSYLNNITSDVQAQIDRFNNNTIEVLNTYTNNGVRTIYQSILAYINGLSSSSKPRGFIQFMITYNANTMPSDLPSSENQAKWNYAWGEIYFRHNTSYEDATIILHPFTDDSMIIKQVLNSEEKTWQTVLTDKSSMIADLVSGKVDRFVSSSSGTSQTIDVGALTTSNRMYLLSAGYFSAYGDFYVFGLILINSSGSIKYASLKDTQTTVSVTYTDGIVSLTFSDKPYSNAVLIRLS